MKRSTAMPATPISYLAHGTNRLKYGIHYCKDAAKLMKRMSLFIEWELQVSWTQINNWSLHKEMEISSLDHMLNMSWLASLKKFINWMEAKKPENSWFKEIHQDWKTILDHRQVESGKNWRNNRRIWDEDESNMMYGFSKRIAMLL